MHIVAIHRPLTALYAAVAVFAGFRMATGLCWFSAIVALAFSLVTANIMVFNDLLEREQDMKKGKDFCHKYTWLTIVLFAYCCAKVVVLLLVISYEDRLVSVFIAFVWLVGLVYSFRFVRKLYIVQSIIVALCSASPILCGAVFARTTTPSVILAFFSLSVLILMREFLKDAEDVVSDSDYKETLPTRKGIPSTIVVVMLLSFVAAGLLTIFPVKGMIAAAFALALVEGSAGLALMHPERCHFVKHSIDIVLCCLLLIILIVS
jgi:4-hydroxybenzoate polyprenyltransferase